MPFLRKRPEMRGGLWRRRKSEPNKSAAMHTQHCETNNYWNKRLRRCVTSSKVTETVTLSRHTACSTTSLSNSVTMRPAWHSNPRANNRDEWWSKGRQPRVITSKLIGEKSPFDLTSLSNSVTMRPAWHSNPRANNRDEWWSKGRQPRVITSKLIGEKSPFDL